MKSAEPARKPATSRLASEPETWSATAPVSVRPAAGTVVQSSGVAPVPAALLSEKPTLASVALAIVPSVSEPDRPLAWTPVQLRPSGVAGASEAIVIVAAGPPKLSPKLPVPTVSVGEVSVITRSVAPVSAGDVTSTACFVSEKPVLPVTMPAMSIVALPASLKSMLRVSAESNVNGRIPAVSPAQLSFAWVGVPPLTLL